MPAGIVAIIAAVLFVILLIGLLIGSPMCSANKHYSRLEVENTTFEQEFSEVDWNSVPQIDKDSSAILGNRKMGTLTDMVSQFNVMNEYTIINYNGSPVRVSPLGYDGLFKYNNNKINGIPGYIIVNGVTKEAEYVELENGMQYSPSSYFDKDLKRYLRRNYRTTMFGEFSFEIDDEGNPYWVIPTYKYAAGFGGAHTPTGCILLDPVTGKHQAYSLNEVPEWVDAALEPNLVVGMINSWGKYANGFWNTWFGQQGVKVSTQGYNYVTIGNDVYLYTGITSVVADESNIGFILVNMRTGDAKYFELDSAEEYSAMDSAKGQVQHLNYEATFPILINVKGVPTYFLSLKDAAGLVKMYSFVSVQNIQQVVVTDASEGVEFALNNYLKMLKLDETNKSEEAQAINATITVKEVYTAIIEGNTHYYIVTDDSMYVASIANGKYVLPVIKQGDTLNVSYYDRTTHKEIISVEVTVNERT